MRINRYRKKLSQSFCYLNKSSNCWEWGLPSVPSPGEALWPWRREQAGTETDLANQPRSDALSPISSSYVFTFLQFAGPRSLKTIFFCLIPSLHLYFSLLRCCVGPSSNHLWVTHHWVSSTGMCAAHVNKLCCSLVNLSFVSLIFRPQLENVLRRAGGKPFFPSLHWQANKQSQGCTR